MANINIRIDEKVKYDAEKVFSELGLNPTTAITLFYKQVIRTGSIPFELKTEIPNRTTRKALKEVEKMGKNLIKTKTYKSIDDLMEDAKKWLFQSNNQPNLKKDLKKCIKRGLDLEQLRIVILLLQKGETIPEKYKDHPLLPTKEFINCRELHIEPDWLLVYKYSNRDVILYLVRTGTHSDLFKWFLSKM